MAAPYRGGVALQIEAARVILLALMVFANACAAQNPGIIDVDVNGKAFLYLMQKISPGTNLSFQYPNDKGDAACCRSINASDLAMESADERVSEASSDKSAYRYAVHRRFKSRDRMPFVGMAVTAERRRVTQPQKNALWIHGADRSFEMLLCTSQEGVHVLSGPAGSPSSDLYFALGYDVEPSCPEY